MTQCKAFPLMILAGALTSTAIAGPQDQRASDLQSELQARFAPTKLEKTRVVTLGAVVIVQKDGIGAIAPSSGLNFSYPNNYKSGAIHHDGKAVFLTNSGVIRDLFVNEPVYVIKIEVKDATVLIGVQSCGNCDPNAPDPEHLPVRANVTFQFGKPYLASATPAQVSEIISHVFAPTNGGPGGSAPLTPGPSAATPQYQPAAAMTPIAPPPPPVDAPPPAAVEVKIGQTTDQVNAALGQPLQIFNLGAKVIYKYKGLKVTFINGKVTDVE
jgi:hypothetical protein